MAKYTKCILNPEKNCDDCNKCDLCDLAPSKICDNCGKCLEKGAENGMRSLEISEVMKEEEKNIDWLGEDITSNYSEEDDECPFEFIEDVEGLKEILTDEEMSEKFTYEEFPGLIKIKKMK